MTYTFSPSFPPALASSVLIINFLAKDPNSYLRKKIFGTGFSAESAERTPSSAIHIQSERNFVQDVFRCLVIFRR